MSPGQRAARPIRGLGGVAETTERRIRGINQLGAGREELSADVMGGEDRERADTMAGGGHLIRKQVTAYQLIRHFTTRAHIPLLPVLPADWTARIK